jgi:hypothetical protein
MDVLGLEERGIQFEYVVHSTQNIFMCAAHGMFDWMIRFAHPFGAVLRTFSALRASSGVRRNDARQVNALCANSKFGVEITPAPNSHSPHRQ